MYISIIFFKWCFFLACVWRERTGYMNPRQTGQTVDIYAFYSFRSTSRKVIQDHSGGFFNVRHRRRSRTAKWNLVARWVRGVDCVCVCIAYTHTHIQTKRLTINNQRKISKGEARRHKHMCSYRDFGLGIECVVRRTTSHILHEYVFILCAPKGVYMVGVLHTIYICCDDVRDMFKYNIEK